MAEFFMNSFFSLEPKGIACWATNAIQVSEFLNHPFIRFPLLDFLMKNINQLDTI